jgi:hypothetical protein
MRQISSDGECGKEYEHESREGFPGEETEGGV